jgi:hypothetical protein
MLGIKALQTRINLGPDWYAVGLSTKVPDKFQGYHGNVLVVVDEASGVNDPAIWAAITGNLTSAKNDRLLAIGNPLDPDSVFAQKFKIPQRKGWNNHITISAFDVPNVQLGKEVIPHLVSKEWVEQREYEWGVDSPLYQARVLGEFPKVGKAALFPLHWLERAFAYNTNGFSEPVIDNGVPTGEYEWVPGNPDVSQGLRVLSLDVSGSGMDNNAMCYLTGRKIGELVGWPGVDSSDILGDDGGLHHKPTYFDYVRRLRPDMGVIDALGLGDAIYGYAKKYIKAHKDELRGFRVRPFKASATAVRDGKYENFKAEAYFLTRSLLQENALDWSNVTPQMQETLLKQANAIKYQTSKRGLIMIESKDQMRARVEFSPDELEAVIMAIAGGKKIDRNRPTVASFDYGTNYDREEESGMVKTFDYDLTTYSR